MANAAKLEAMKLQKQEFEERARKMRQQLDARIKQEEAKLATAARKRDTRRKVLLGALLDAWMAEDHSLRPEVEKRLGKFLQKRVDFEVFDMDVPEHLAEQSGSRAGAA